MASQCQNTQGEWALPKIESGSSESESDDKGEEAVDDSFDVLNDNSIHLTSNRSFAPSDDDMGLGALTQCAATAAASLMSSHNTDFCVFEFFGILHNCKNDSNAARECHGIMIKQWEAQRHQDPTCGAKKNHAKFD